MKVCPKCAYTRVKTDSNVPEWQCPKCGIAYAKFEAEQLGNWEAKRGVVPTTTAVRESPSPLKTVVWIVAAVVLGVLLSPYGAPKGGFLREMLDAGSAPGASQQGGPPPEALAMSPEALAGLAQITPDKVVVFSTAWCGYCTQVKRLLDRQGVRYTELDLERDPRGGAFQEQYMLIRGFPVTIVGSRIIVGFDEKEILAGLKRL
jgi:glutaredoxin